MKFRFLFLFFCLTPGSVFSQQTFQPQHHSKKLLFNFSGNVSNSDSIVNVIVEFKEQPLFLAQKNSLGKISSSQYENRFSQFKNDLDGIISQTKIAKFASTGQKQFYKTFFGMGAKVSQGMIPFIEQLSYVKKVHHNRTVKAFIHKSVPQIRANEVWSNFGFKGDGVVVGIIDSGIDYLHPALGGGIGSSFKVIGGYDLANGDNDPMDDNGHGTHVAGIVAADALNIQGVAPKAKLFALKVLDAEGSGSEIDVIDAIERTVDPNQDGDMSDKLDVVNMSLGIRNGNPDDAASVAVDNATLLGITFCIAAGNEGNAELVEGKENNYYYNGSETIGSPGTARSAITVGAIDSVNKLAIFSSKGPTRGNFGIKPEVVAPGVNIRSLFPDGNYMIESGTSMASPMIAGVAALLKSKDKNLTPSQIKSAIVNSSVDLGLKTNHQGAGRVDAMRAISISTFAQPSQISYGLDDPSQATWTKVETVKVSNTKNISQNYSISFAGTPSGITLSAAPQNFSIATGGSQDVLITVSVNNAVIPIVEEDIILYGGFAHIKSAADTLHLPWLFVRTSRMILSFSESNPQFVGSSFNYYVTPLYNKFYSKIRWLDSKTIEVAGAFSDTYDFAVYFSNSSKIVLKENLQFTGSGSFSFNAADAVHKIYFDGVDNNNIPLSSFGKTKRSLRVNLPNGFLFASLKENVSAVSISSASNNFGFQGVEALVDPKGTKRVILPQYATFKGISGDVHLTNVSTAYLNQTLRFRTPPGVSKTRVFSDIITTEISAGETFYNTILLGIDTVDAQGGELMFDLYMMKQIDPVFGSTVSFHTNGTYEKDNYLDLSTRYFSIVNDSLMPGFPSQNWLTTHKSPDGGTMRFGETPIHIMNLSYNNSFGSSIHFDPLFRGSLNEVRYHDHNYGKYAIFNNSSGAKLKEEALNVYPRYPFEVEPGKYRLEIESQGYVVKNAKGKISLVNYVDLTKTVPDPPYITSFALLNSAKTQSNNFVQNENAQLIFSSKIYSFPVQLPVSDSTKVFYRQFKTSNWLPLPVTKISDQLEQEGSVFSVSLANATTVDSVAIDLKIRIVDESGNSTEQILSPAFSVGNWTDDGSTDVEEGDDFFPTQFTLYQNYPNPFNPVTEIVFTLHSPGFTSLKVYDAIGREVSVLVNEFRESGKYHKAKFNASRLSTGMYFARLQNGEQVQLKKMLLIK